MAPQDCEDQVLLLRQQLREEQERRIKTEYSLQLAQDIIDGINAIIWEADHQTFQFKFVNKRAEAILGYPVSAWLKDPAFWLSILHPEDRKWAVTFCSTATEQGRDHEFEYRAIARDGRVVWLHDKVYVIRDAAGNVQKLRGFMADITEKKKAQESLRDTHERLRLAQEIAGFGVADWNIRNGDISWSVELPVLKGLASSNQLSEWLTLVHPEDRVKVDAELDRAVRELDAYDINVRLVPPQGPGVSLHIRGQVLPGDDGKAARALVVVMPMTGVAQPA